MLTGLDLFRVSKALNMTPQEVIEKKTVGYIGDQSHVPVLTLRERLDGSCSLLRKGKCMVQESKPVVCAIYPLGRMYNAMTREINYFRQAYDCQTKQSGSGSGGKTWTLQEWLDAFHIPDLDKASMVWNRMLTGIAQVTCKIPIEQLPDKMIGAVSNCLYTNYKIDEPYIEQAETNMLILKLLFSRWYNLNIDYDIKFDT